MFSFSPHETMAWSAGDSTRRSNIRRLVNRPMTTTPEPRNGLLWIDGVGGYWVCRGERIVLGPPQPQDAPDLPLWGDLSRRHASFVLDEQGYRLEAERPVYCNELPIGGSLLPLDGQLLRFGSSLRMRFRQPHPWTRTARLEWQGPARTRPHTDGVLLAAEVCILGPDQQSHVVCPKWTQELLLAPRETGWQVKFRGSFAVNGEPHRDTAEWNGTGPLELPCARLLWEPLPTGL